MKNDKNKKLIFSFIVNTISRIIFSIITLAVVFFDKIEEAIKRGGLFFYILLTLGILVLFGIIFFFPKKNYDPRQKNCKTICEPTAGAWEKAYKNLGQKVPLNPIHKWERADFFHYTEIQEYAKVIMFSKGNFKVINKKGKEYGKQKIAIYVIFLLLTALLMTIALFILWRYNNLWISNNDFLFIFPGITLLLAMATTVPIFGSACLFTIITTGVFLYASYAKDACDKLTYIRALTIFYIYLCITIFI